MESNEQKIIQRCQQGKTEEFALLYDQYVKKIYTFVYYKTHHQEIAEDLTSKIFFKALKNISKFDKKENYFSAWLYKIARNTVIDHYRTKKNHLNIDDAWDLLGEENADEYDNKQKLEKVKKYINRLKPEHRDILIMRLWQEMSYKEIAEALNKSEPSCKMAFSRLINQLRKDMPLALFISLLINI